MKSGTSCTRPIQVYIYIYLNTCVCTYIYTCLASFARTSKFLFEVGRSSQNDARNKQRQTFSRLWTGGEVARG